MTKIFKKLSLNWGKSVTSMTLNDSVTLIHIA